MNILNAIMGLFSSGDTSDQTLILIIAAVTVINSLRAFLVILAPMTKTKVDDKLANVFTKVYNMTARLTDHQKK